MLRFHLVSLFPEFFRSPLETALLGRAREAGIVDFSFHDPRSFSTSRHHHVDDRPYGGGNATGVKIEPIGFLVIKEGTVRMINVTPPASNTVDRIIDMVPQVMDRVDNFIDKQKNK